MKKRLVAIAVSMLVIAFVGCTTPSIEIEDIEIWVTGFEQEVACSSVKAGTVEIMRAYNGELPTELTKCPPCATCCPPCP
ncbi:MAG: hypothetical protein PHF45_02290, partial [Candidatus Pacebacteria bacterium]|nr:hypothetical protein [Candidatus Paceibacterota bacterium]